MGDIKMVGELRARKVFGMSPDEDHIVIEQADRYIRVADEFLADLDPRFAHFGDGILTVHGVLGDISYGLSSHDPYLRQWLGTRADNPLERHKDGGQVWE